MSNASNNETVLTVSQFTALLKENLENQYRFVKICGEISNLKTPFSGHSYFTLKDAGAQIRAVLFKQQKRFVALKLEDGQQVVVFARIAVYEPRGEYQLVIDSVELYGIGKLLRDFERLKQKLSDKGYFSSSFKITLPAYPAKIVVISSPTGAAIQDFLRIISNRKSPVHIQILPVKVQGEAAAREIARALDTAQGIVDTDIIVLCRGGGSIEDLWAFNEECVAEAIHRSTIPVVTGIGHETDLTIADLCADLRCPTPTGVAERLVPDADNLRLHVRSLRDSLKIRMERKISAIEKQLLHLNKMFGNMGYVFDNLHFRLDLSKAHLIQAMIGCLHTKEKRYQRYTQNLNKVSPVTHINLRIQTLNLLVSEMKNHMQRTLDAKSTALSKQAGLLQGVSPLATLARGYAVVRNKQPEDASWHVVSRASDTSVGEELNIVLQEGQLDCLVTNIIATKSPD